MHCERWMKTSRVQFQEGPIGKYNFLISTSADSHSPGYYFWLRPGAVENGDDPMAPSQPVRGKPLGFSGIWSPDETAPVGYLRATLGSGVSLPMSPTKKNLLHYNVDDDTGTLWFYIVVVVYD